MTIKDAQFVVSSPSVDRCPQTDAHEYAFIGRSNVGKSSLINMLTGRKKLALTSSTPGKTMTINHFGINGGEWYIVDLPGYGYARRGRDSRDELARMIDGYILGRRQMTNLFVLIDSRHAPQKIDLEFMRHLGENSVPFSIVFTKADKLGRQVLENNIHQYCDALLEEWEALPPVFVTSAEDSRGRDALLDYIGQMNRLPLAEVNNDEG